MSKDIKALRGPILVLGASGFIGANLFKLIAAQRDDVFAVVQHEKGWRLSDVLDSQIIAADLTDRTETKNVLDTIAPQTVFDCVAYGAYSFEKDISKIYETNLQSLVWIVKLLSEKGITAFIHAGSSSEYGTNPTAPLEADRCEPNSHYAVSKVAAAEFLKYMGGTMGFPCAHLRLYSIYGPLEDTSRLIPALVKSAIEGKLPPLVDPRTSRDFVYVADTCDAFIAAAAKMNPKLYGESINIGSGVKTTIADLATVTKEHFGITAQPQYGSMPGKDWDLPDWYSNPQKAKELIGWESKTSLVDGLDRTREWVATLTDAAFISSSKSRQDKRERSCTAVVACYKDAEAIPYMHRRLTETFKKLEIEYEIIFVNDGSPDNSAEVIMELSTKDAHVVGINHSRNFGSQMAFRSGMELATMNSVVLLDGDLQDPPELIETFHEKWLEGNDVVYGQRVKREMPWYWGLLYKGFYRVFAAFSYIKIPLDAGDFSLMDKRVVTWLLQCPERDLFMRGLRAYVGFKQTGVHYDRPERMFGTSTNNLLKNIDWAKRGIFSFSEAPMAMLTSSGVITFLASITLSIIVAINKIINPSTAPHGIITILIVVLLFGSINLLAIGLVGEYVAKILMEVKGRPRLIRSGIIRRGVLNHLLPDGKIKK